MASNPMQDLLRRQLGIDAFALDGDSTNEPEDVWTDRTGDAHSAEQPVALKPLERRWSFADPPKRN